MNSSFSDDSGGWEDLERAWERERETKEEVRDSGEEGVMLWVERKRRFVVVGEERRAGVETGGSRGDCAVSFNEAFPSFPPG